MFYHGADFNPNLPPAIDPNPGRVVPSQKPKPEFVEAENLKRAAKAAAVAMQASKDAATAAQSYKRQKTGPKTIVLDGTRDTFDENADVDASERRALLREIKDHLDILKEFKGIIPESDLVKRKRSLFALLPEP